MARKYLTDAELEAILNESSDEFNDYDFESNSETEDEELYNVPQENPLSLDDDFGSNNGKKYKYIFYI